jgi:transcription initiation factor IIE alpha subunit
MKRQHRKAQRKLEKEQQNKNVFFICQKACARLDFDQATEFDSNAQNVRLSFAAAGKFKNKLSI